MKVMLDTNIYDALYLDPETKELLLKYVKADNIILYSIAIQEDELNQIKKIEKREECLLIHRHANILPAQGFSYDIEGAGYGANWATSEDSVLYDKIRGNSSPTNNIKDTLIALTLNTNTIEIFVSNDPKFLKRIKREVPQVQTFNFNEFSNLLNTM